MSPGTIKRTHGILRRALQQGVRWGWLGVNPAVGATPPWVLPSELRPPTPAELNRLLDTAERKNPEFATFVTLSATSGARRSELLALRWPDVAHATLTTTPGVARRRGHVTMTCSCSKSFAVSAQAVSGWRVCEDRQQVLGVGEEADDVEVRVGFEVVPADREAWDGPVA